MKKDKFRKWNINNCENCNIAKTEDCPFMVLEEIEEHAEENKVCKFFVEVA